MFHANQLFTSDSSYPATLNLLETYEKLKINSNEANRRHYSPRNVFSRNVFSGNVFSRTLDRSDLIIIIFNLLSSI